MIQPTARQRRAWLRRAETLHRRAAALLSDMIAAVGTEHEVTDFADNVVHQSESLTSVLGSPQYKMWQAQ